ncbi:MAG TPA: DMT family transporter [Leucothrix mucor]|nr:DMT family transporter [Leucothrix mucor]
MNTSSTETTIKTQAEQKNFRLGIFFAIAGTALFSLKSIFIKLAFLEGIDATTLLTLRMLVAFPLYVVVLVYAIKTRPEKAALMTKKDTFSILVLGFLGYYLASYLDFEGLSYVSAQLERLTLFTYPIMVALLSWLFFKEKITLNILASLVVSYIGVSFLFFNEAPNTSTAGVVNDGKVALGTALVALAAFSFALYVIFSKAFISRLGTLIFTSLMMSSSLVFILIHFFATHELSDLNVSPKLWMLVGFLSVFSTFIPSFFTSEAIHRIGATRTSIVGTIGPVVTIILAVNLLDEAFGLPQIIGLLLVLLGVSLLRAKKKSS